MSTNDTDVRERTWRAIAWFAFGNLLGNGSENVIREGTVMSALLTGLCMRFTDKLADVMVPASVKKYL